MKHIFIVLVAIAVGCGRKSPTATSIQPGSLDAATSFTNLLLPTLPATLSELQGKTETWQGYNAYLRFTTDLPTIDAIIATGYRQCAFPTEASRVQLVWNTNFSPPWQPARSGVQAYEKTNVTNAWTHHGTHYLIIDRTNRVVHFVGGGA